MPYQHGVLRDRDHVVEPRAGIQEVEDLRCRKARVEPNEEPRPWKRAAQQRQQPRHQGHRSLGPRPAAPPEVLHRVRGRTSRTPAAEPVEEGELQQIGRVQIDRDHRARPCRPLDDALGQLGYKAPARRSRIATASVATQALAGHRVAPAAACGWDPRRGGRHRVRMATRCFEGQVFERVPNRPAHACRQTGRTP